MSAIDSLSATGTQSATGTDAYSSLTSGDFLKIIFTELSKQDPLQPSDTSTLVKQLSDIRNIQSSVDLSDKLTKLVAQDQLSAAAGMIGMQVSGISESLARVSGRVKSVSQTQDGAVLTLTTGDRVPMKYVDEVVSGDAKTAETAP